MRFVRLSCLFTAILCATPIPATASTPSTRRAVRSATDRVRVFLDCANTWCDFDFIRTEITFVDWVRTRQDADVHVLVTSQRTAAGGTEYTLAFIGIDRFAGQDSTLIDIARPASTSDEIRKGLVRVLGLGLVRYVASTADGLRLRVAAEAAPAAPPAASQAAHDPWNLWVFRTRVATRMDGEERVSSSSVNGNLAASRVTEEWKINLSLDGQYSHSHFEFDDGTPPYSSVSRNWALRGLFVNSLTGKWSAGLRTSAASSTYLNQRLVARVAPAIEYNIFPYAESTRRRWTVQYATGPRYAEYYEPTVYNKTQETLWDHSLSAELDLKQPWGTWNSSVDMQQYFYDLSKYRVGFDNEFDVRLFRGLSLNLNSNAQIIRNQIYLAAGGATPQEILVRQRQLATSYSYYVSFGISYTFGSIYNNVVNRRFGG